MSLLAKVWRRYRARKSRRGIVSDFLFLLAMIVALVPPLRRGLMTCAVGVMLVQPRLYDKIVFVGAEDSVLLRTPAGADTIVALPLRRPALFNVGSVWRAQTRAELGSLDGLARRYAGQIDVFFVSTDEPADVVAFLDGEGHTALRPLFLSAEDCGPGVGEERLGGVLGQLLMSVPSSALVRPDGLLVVKKLGAARWSGASVERACDVALGR